jgi:hypothetical protein
LLFSPLLSEPQHAREAILAHTAAEGTPTGCAYLDVEDEAAATEAFVEALPAVAFDSAEWGDDGPDDADRSIPAGAVLVPPELEPLDDHPGESYEEAAPVLPPIAGGAPEPYRPTEDDWREYREHFDRLDRLEAIDRDIPEQPRFGYE